MYDQTADSKLETDINTQLIKTNNTRVESVKMFEIHVSKLSRGKYKINHKY